MNYFSCEHMSFSYFNIIYVKDEYFMILMKYFSSSFGRMYNDFVIVLLCSSKITGLGSCRVYLIYTIRFCKYCF